MAHEFPVTKIMGIDGTHKFVTGGEDACVLVWDIDTLLKESKERSLMGSEDLLVKK
eukprot:CAMPEP_0116874964 /NCGR_PEP_ID=MMETSP0463-20121206/6618_1 /TAXON_ID=181622 /ORGANISM="Strombidinopsis sp, Strain SopsisLIS2011" /LENGTH=55 /DNA_ID=CAMNT_0004519519 /DNA_START=979 /DNA_END=1146 /DNA_ORIENTATION=+